MPHEGYADPITNDELGFHSDMPVSEFAERGARAIEASVVSLTLRLWKLWMGRRIKLGRPLLSPTGLGGSSRLTLTRESN